MTSISAGTPTSPQTKRAGATSSTLRNGRNTLETYASPVFGKAPVGSDRHVDSDKGSGTAVGDKARNRRAGSRPEETVLDWAKVRGLP